MSLRSPLGNVLGLGTAKDGTGHWWSQRVTAVALVFLGGWFAATLVGCTGLADVEFDTVREFFGRPLNGILMILFSGTLAYHSWLGIQVVIEDYVHSEGLKIVSLMLSRFVHIFAGIACAYSVLRIGFGG